MKQSEALKCLGYLEGAYRTTLEPNAVLVYLEFLIPLEVQPDVIKEALKSIVRHSSYFPRVSELMDTLENHLRMKEMQQRPKEIENTWMSMDELNNEIRRWREEREE